jgi:hypothetical protein
LNNYYYSGADDESLTTTLQQQQQSIQEKMEFLSQQFVENIPFIGEILLSNTTNTKNTQSEPFHYLTTFGKIPVEARRELAKTIKHSGMITEKLRNTFKLLMQEYLETDSLRMKWAVLMR